MKRLTKRLTSVIAVMLFLLAVPLRSFGGSATWRTNPTSGDWNTAANWMPNTVPNSSTDVATFGASSIRNISNQEFVTLDSIVFSQGASSYTIAPETNIFLKGAGVVNNSAIVQSFSEPDRYGFIYFYNEANAGELIHYSGTFGNGFVFYDSSSAGSATFDVGSVDGYIGEVSFSDGLNYKFGWQLRFLFGRFDCSECYDHCQRLRRSFFRRREHDRERSDNPE